MSSPTSDNIEPFPTIDEGQEALGSPTDNAFTKQRPAASSSLSGRLRRISQSFGESNPPEGFSAATGGIASSVFSRQVQSQSPHASPMAIEQNSNQSASANPSVDSKADSVAPEEKTSAKEPPTAAPCPNGYHFPPKHTFAHSTKLGMIAFWKYFTSPIGFVVTIYGLNIVAWGGMLFLLLCNACKLLLVPGHTVFFRANVGTSSRHVLSYLQRY